MAPQYDYFHDIFLPIASRHFGFSQNILSMTVLKRGYYPRGGDIINVKTNPLRGRPLTPITLTDRGEVSNVTIRSFHAGKVGRKKAVVMANAAKELLERECFDNCDGNNNNGTGGSLNIRNVIINERDSVGSAAGLLIVAETTTGCLLGGSALGRPKVAPEVTGEDAARELIDCLNGGGCVDDWLQDQLILYMALADGVSTVLTGGLTLHTRTAIMIAERLCPGLNFEVSRVDEEMEDGTMAVKSEEYGKDGCLKGRHLIRCQGIGYVNMH
mmetsp:Transcript_21545/g.26663  ORF Transcript_21545/g.26663 Transcript_21545/m.26663 type:complete len:271 (-) Transcript_21545:10-822(-)